MEAKGDSRASLHPVQSASEQSHVKRVSVKIRRAEWLSEGKPHVILARASMKRMAVIWMLRRTMSRQSIQAVKHVGQFRHIVENTHGAELGQGEGMLSAVQM